MNIFLPHRALQLPLALLFLLPLSLPTRADSFSNHFAVVFVDNETEAKLGSFPLDRAYNARAVEQAAALHARAVVFKFFFDRPANTNSDAQLARSFTNLPVVLEACLDDTERHPNPLPTRFTLPNLPPPSAPAANSGWIPLPMFSAPATDVGFVDFSTTDAPVLESYQGRAVKSLLLCCLEAASGHTASIEPGKRLTLGPQHLALDAQNHCHAVLPPRDECPYIPFHRLLTGDIPPSALAGKVVIIGYDGPNIHAISTSLGPIRAHRFFAYVLQSLWDQLRP